MLSIKEIILNEKPIIILHANNATNILRMTLTFEKIWCRLYMNKRRVSTLY